MFFFLAYFTLYNRLQFHLKHLLFKMQTLLKELSLYCPLKLSSKRKVSCVKGGRREIEHKEANFGPPFIALGRAKKHPSTEYLSGKHEATPAY